MINGQYWDDGSFAVIPVKEWMRVRALGKIGRSITYKDPAECVANGHWDALKTTPPGPASQNSWVKVRIADFKGPTGITTVRVNDQESYTVKTPTKKVIPDWPHTCLICGGKMLVLFSSTEHEGGECPGPKARVKRL